MLKNSFLFLEKISKKKEQNIWKQGIKNWDDFLKAASIRGISKKSKFYYTQKIKEAQQALLNDDSTYFINKLPQKDIWRIYPHFKEAAAYLDLEVDSYGKIILVGISNYYQTNTFVKYVNLEKEYLEQELKKYKLLITFNGSAFDLPKLKKQFQLEIKIPHLDLKPLCVKLKLSGGLKQIERTLGLKRPQNLYGNPVELWKAFYASGDKEYLDLLIS